MLYSLFLITFGIYLGQEYPSIPSIKVMCLYSLERFKTHINEEADKEPTLSSIIKTLRKNVLGRTE